MEKRDSQEEGSQDEGLIGDENPMQGRSPDVPQQSEHKTTTTIIRHSAASVVRRSSQRLSSDESAKCSCEQCENAQCNCRGEKDESWKGESTMAKAVRKDMAVKLPPISPDASAKEDEMTLRSTDSWTADIRGKRGKWNTSWFQNGAICAVVVGLVVAAAIVVKRSMNN